jgi:beta-lactamase regulating signal transducer with metallopeptidase domain
MPEVMAWALVHFMWQGAALGLVAAVAMRLCRSSVARYAIGVGTLAAMVLAVGLTMASAGLTPPYPGPAQLESTAALTPSNPSNTQPDATPIQSDSTASANALPTWWILGVWIAGVVVLSVRLLGGWLVARRAVHEAVVPVSDELQRVASAIARRVGVRRAVQVLESATIAVPVMIGWWRPVVLVPTMALTGLTAAHIEAILAHEFAHIRRHDYLVNILQSVVETILFFHPAVWWVSRQIRRERELCCDDMAVAVVDRVTYATALSQLAHLRPAPLVLAVTDGSLRDRVRRVMSHPSHSESAKGGWMAMLPLVLVLSLAAPSAFTQDPKPVVKPVEPILVPILVAPPVELNEPAAIELVPVLPPQKAVHPPTLTFARPEPAGAQGEAQQREAAVRAREMLDLEHSLAQLELERRKVELERMRNLTENEAIQAELIAELQRARRSLPQVAPEHPGRIAVDAELRAIETRIETARRQQQLIDAEIAIKFDELQLRERVLRESAAQLGAVRQLGMADTIAAGDRVTIRIVGESGITSDFTVAANGSIRYPFFGEIKIEGATTAEVAKTMAKLLTDRALMSNPEVTVTATRRQ